MLELDTLGVMENKAFSQRKYDAARNERLQMVEHFRHSGLSRAAFCRQYGIPISTLNYWLSKTRCSSPVPLPMIFKEVKLTPSKIIAADSWATEVVTPSGLTIRLREKLSVCDLVYLLGGGRC